MSETQYSKFETILCSSHSRKMSQCYSNGNVKHCIRRFTTSCYNYSLTSSFSSYNLLRHYRKKLNGRRTENAINNFRKSIECCFGGCSEKTSIGFSGVSEKNIQLNKYYIYFREEKIKLAAVGFG